MEGIEGKEELQLKKKNSYTYWVDENNKSKELPPSQRPIKLQGAVAAKHTLEQPLQQGPSQWNTSGTWEQRKVSLLQLQDAFTATYIKHPLNGLVFKAIALKGECETVFSRNKKALLYELKGQILFQTQAKELKIQIDDLTDHGDRQYHVQTDNLQQKQLLQKEADTIIQTLQNCIKNLLI